MASVLVAVPPAVSVAALGRIVQAPAAVPLAVVTEQRSWSVPAKAPVEAMVMASTLPVVAPDMSV